MLLQQTLMNEVTKLMVLLLLFVTNLTHTN